MGINMKEKIDRVNELCRRDGVYKNLTTGQIELILKKNKIVIPKEFNTSFFKENISKPIV